MKKILTFSMALLGMLFFAESAKALTYTVQVPEGTKYVYITGEMNAWSTSKHQLTKIGDNLFSIDIEGATTAQKYQYLSGADWKYIEKDANGEAIQDRTWSELDVVVQWLNTFSPDERDITIEALVPNDVIELYLVGTFNGWASPSEPFKMKLEEETIDGKVFSITIFSNDAINTEFKFVAGPAWAYEQTDPKDNFVFGTTENTVSVVVNEFKAYFDPAKTGTINIKAHVPIGTPRVWIQGDHLGWSMEKATEGVRNEDGTFSFSIPMVMSISYRLYNKPDWGYPEVDGEGKERPNREATYPEDANIEITVLGWKNMDTGVKKIQEATNRIYSNNNVLYVEDVKTKVELFDISGRMVQTAQLTGTFKSDILNSGFYILKVDGASKKVSVR